MISRSIPTSSRTRRRNSSQLSARRQASVAILRDRVTRRRRILPAQTFSAAMVREMASSESRPEALTPSPRRTIRENASTMRNPLRVGRATSSRQLFVPRSSAAYTCRQRPRGRRRPRETGDAEFTNVPCLGRPKTPTGLIHIRVHSSSISNRVERRYACPVRRSSSPACDARLYTIPIEHFLLYLPPHRGATASSVLLGDRLMVGQQVLALPVGVRVPLPQPIAPL